MTSKQNFRVLAIATLTLAGSALAQDMPTGAPNQQATLEWLSMPSDVAVGKDNNIYVVNGGNHQVAVFDATGSRTATLGEMGSSVGQFTSPLGIGISSKGEVWVADKGNNRLVMFDAKGKFRRNIPLEEEGDDVVPVDVAVGPKGKELFVTANNSHKVLVFSTKGELLRSWGGEGEDDGQFRFPATIDIVKLPRSMDLTEFVRRYPSTVEIEKLALINGVNVDTVMDPGRLVKRVVGGELPKN